MKPSGWVEASDVRRKVISRMALYRVVCIHGNGALRTRALKVRLERSLRRWGVDLDNNLGNWAFLTQREAKRWFQWLHQHSTLLDSL